MFKKNNNMFKKNNNILQEENNIFQEENNIFQEENNIFKKNNNMFQEENNIIEEESKKLYKLHNNLLEEENNIIEEENNIIEEENNIIEEEIHSTSETKPNLNKFIMNPPIPNNASGYGPLNINISYNAQNSINELDNNSEKNNSERNNGNEKNSDSKLKEKNKSKNLGDFNNERIHTNSDWIYGSSAWTNEPDYYIPTKDIRKSFNEIPQPLNELINSKKYKGKTEVCPLMINTPWTEYKSGDSEPEPYNL
jgi:hypothetical protein